MTPLQAKLFYWMECIKCKRTQLKLRVVYWWTHKTQAEATQAIKESRDWAHSLSKEQVQECIRSSRMVVICLSFMRLLKEFDRSIDMERKDEMS